MKLIAVHSVHGRKVLRAPDPKNSRDRGRSLPLVAKPGDEFDTVEFGLDDKEALALVARGSAKRKMREVTDADEAGTGGEAKQPNAPAT